MPTTISICNVALAEVGADSIASLDEESVGARECRRAFDDAVADLLARSDWGFKTRRLNAAGVPNDRPAEWSYAYAMPADAARVLRVLPPAEANYPEWGIWSTPAWDALGAVPFVEAGGTIHCNVADAVIEVASASAPASDFPPLFRRALEFEIAARIAMPLRRDRALRGDMLQLAELALARAIAEDRNRHPRRELDWLGEVALARAGVETGGAC